MDLQLRGAVTVVLGASRDVGRETVLVLAREGARVAAVGRPGSPVAAVVEEATGAGGTAIAVEADLLEDGAVDRVLTTVADTLGPPEAVVVTVGPFPRGVDADVPALGSDADWQQVFDEVFLAVARVGRAALPRLSPPDAVPSSWSGRPPRGRGRPRRPIRDDEGCRGAPRQELGAAGRPARRQVERGAAGADPHRRDGRSAGGRRDGPRDLRL